MMLGHLKCYIASNRSRKFERNTRRQQCWCMEELGEEGLGEPC